MSTNILATNDRAAFYCTTEMRAFGPVFQSKHDAVQFREWLDNDPRSLYNANELGELYREWVRINE